VLEALFAAAAAESKKRRETIPESMLLAKISHTLKPADVYEALARSSRIKLIAEIKRASPSRGFLAEIANPEQLAMSYQTAGADAISVLTETSSFMGTLEDLERVSQSVQIPVLRKDFISTEYQLMEARAAGASFALLILAQLTANQANGLMKFAHEIGLSVLVETHSEDELETAARLGARLIGINTRDLTTFQTDISLFERLATLLPESAIRVAESSVKELEDVRRYRDAGADVVLVGEALVTGDHQALIPQIISVS
jgi:indole-3-glycerol phosphate synthase